MPSFLDAFKLLRQGLTALYNHSEANAIARQMLEDFSGQSYSALLVKDTPMDKTQSKLWEEKTGALLTGKPLQQVLGCAYFMGRKFLINEHTLIPRPETEELVTWVVSDWKEKGEIRVLDVGTGSGCIAISLSLELPDAIVSAIDISTEALLVAMDNDQEFESQVLFQQSDFLKEKDSLSGFDVVVSNPPYIPLSEKENLDKNVRDYEPANALFVPNDDPQLFYRHIAEYGNSAASVSAIYCELHQDLALKTKQLFQENGYSVTLRKDLFGNYRMLKAKKKPPGINPAAFYKNIPFF